MYDDKNPAYAIIKLMRQLKIINQEKYEAIITGLKVLFSLLFLWVCYTLISAGIESNLFQQWDFYANVTVIFLWMRYKENSIALRMLWLILLVTLGSIGSCAYMLIQLFSLKPGEGLRQLFGKQNG